MSALRVSTPPYQPLRSHHIDVLLDRAGSLLTHSLDVPETLARLGGLVVPQFADWCSIFLLDEQQDMWRLAWTQHADPAHDALRIHAEGLLGEWKNRGSWTQRVLAGGHPVVIEEVREHWLQEQLPHLVELARLLQVRSALYLPLGLDGKLLGAILLLVIDPSRPRYEAADLRAAQRLATFAAAALRNAKLWSALRQELEDSRRLDKSLRANDAAIRTLAAGLGHDIGNLLQPLRLRLDSLAAMELPRMAVADLKAIGDVMVYLQRLTSGLRLLAGDPAGLAHEVTPLNAWWKDVEAVMKDALPPGIVLDCKLPARLPPARIAPAALTHIVFNLIQNAGQAVSRQNRAAVRLFAERISRRNAVRISVEDNGPAMDADSRRHCFDPFYSARRRRARARVGLPLVRVLVQRSGGDITVRSKARVGTTFAFALPLVERRARPRRATSLSRVARVTVEDPRTWRAMTNLVRAEGFYVDQTEGLLHGPGQVWITDPHSAGGPDELLEFVVENPARVIIMVDATESPIQYPQHPRIHLLSSVADEERLRAILHTFDEPRVGGSGAGDPARDRSPKRGRRKQPT